MAKMIDFGLSNGSPSFWIHLSQEFCPLVRHFIVKSSPSERT